MLLLLCARFGGLSRLANNVLIPRLRGHNLAAPAEAGTGFESAGVTVLTQGGLMGREDVAAGRAKQIRGKLNDVTGAVKGDSGQQLKGKMQQGMGKVQEKLGKVGTRRSRPRGGSAS